MYLNVKKDTDLSSLPEALMQQFGEAAKVMDLLLHAERKLARVEVRTVLEKIEQQGFFLQMPPADGWQVVPPRAESPDA